MCGFTGFFQGAKHIASPRDVLNRMSDCITHRGPDDSGYWLSADETIGFGHRRLSIVDLSPLGSQPMHSPSKRYTIVFNGEIYNFRALRKTLEAERFAFRGHSDTEVMLAAFEQWGVARSLRLFNGMFAFALWDARERTLTLARDRLGEKPIYYGWVGETLVFASELKSLRRFPGFAGEIDAEVLPAYFAYGYIPSPRSIFRGIRKLPPGTSLTIRAGRDDAAPAEYWSLADVSAAQQTIGSLTEARERAKTLLLEAVAMRLEADVPLGALLSGGIDSSLIVALMQAQSARPVRTFTIGYPDVRYDESESAKAVAAHLGTSHTELMVKPDDAFDVIYRLPTIYDEPFADASQIPTALVFQLARTHVTVVLSGDGGDEVFAGYNRHTWGPALWSLASPLPRPLRRGLHDFVRLLSPASWDLWFSRVGSAMPARLRPKLFSERLAGEKLYKVGAVVASNSEAEMYQALTSQWDDVTTLMPCPPGSAHAFLPQVPSHLGDRAGDRILYLDTMTYLPDDILVKVDRASMAASVEARAPFLDHQVVELAWQIPFSTKVSGQTGKRVLRDVLAEYVPPALTNRPKAGFGVPLDAWLRGPLRPWAEEFLDPRRLRAHGYLDVARVRTVWDEHLRGSRNNQYQLWTVIMFEAWLASMQGTN